MSPKKPQYVMIVGAMKAGTTALFSALATHSEILGSLEKEPGFWITDEAPKAGEEAYLRCWNRAAKPHATWLLEGSTHYTKMPMRRSPAGSLARFRGRCRIIYLTRNPVERVRSQYEMGLAKGWLPCSIQEELALPAIWFSNYYMQIRPFIDAFGMDAICALSYEELRSDPASVLQRVAGFLDVDPAGFPPSLPRVNVASQHRKVRAQALREKLGSEGASASEQELHAILDAEITPTEVHIARLHEALDHDLAAFERLFGVEPWTGRRRAENREAVKAPAIERLATALGTMESIRRASRQAAHAS